MKKAITVLCIGILFLLSCSCHNVKNIKNDLSEKKLKGKVKSITEARYDVTEESGEIQKERLLFKEISQYNKKGYLKAVNKCKPDGSVEYKITFRHDEKGNLTERNILKADGSFLYKESYIYDDKGTLTEKKGHKPDGSIEHSETFIYDDKGNIIEMNLFDPIGRLRNVSIYKYDDQGKLIEKEGYNTDGSLAYNVTFTYNETVDKHGNWLIVTVFQDEKPTSITEREIEYY